MNGNHRTQQSPDPVPELNKSHSRQQPPAWVPPLHGNASRVLFGRALKERTPTNLLERRLEDWSAGWNHYEETMAAEPQEDLDIFNRGQYVERLKRLNEIAERIFFYNKVGGPAYGDEERK